MKTLLLLISAVFCATPVSSQAIEQNCTEEIYDAVSRYLKIENFVPIVHDGIIVSEACKSWPHDINFLLVAFAYDKGVENEKSLLVAMLDKKTLEIIADFKAVISEDAVTEAGQNSLQLDTAKFQLTGDIRAFGLHFNSSARGASCAEGVAWDELTLFVQEKNKLRPILKMEMQFQNALNGCIGSATGHDIWEYGRRTISIAKTKSNGFADLLITETISVDANTEEIPKSINTKKKVRTYLMKYNGKEYATE